MALFCDCSLPTTTLKRFWREIVTVSPYPVGPLGEITQETNPAALEKDETRRNGRKQTAKTARDQLAQQVEKLRVRTAYVVRTWPVPTSLTAAKLVRRRRRLTFACR